MQVKRYQVNFVQTGILNSLFRTQYLRSIVQAVKNRNFVTCGNSKFLLLPVQ